MDWMGELHLDPATGKAAGDQALGLQSLDGYAISQPAKNGLAERFSHGEQLQHHELRLGQVGRTQGHQVDQPGRGLQLMPEAPDAVDIG